MYSPVASYFAIFYAAINSGSLVSTVLTPILREDVKCFDDDHCYSLAFAIPGGLMIFALSKLYFKTRSNSLINNKCK